MHALEIHLSTVMLKCFAASHNVGLMFLCWGEINYSCIYIMLMAMQACQVTLGHHAC